MSTEAPMNFVVFGIDHRMQHSEPGLDGMLHAWASKEFFEPLVAIGEEYADQIGGSIGQRLAADLGLRWFNIDMTSDEKHRAGILEEQQSRPKETEAVAYRVPSDEVRERAWVEKLTSSDPGTTIVICGYIHFEPLVRMLRATGNALDPRAYLDTVPEIKLLDKPRDLRIAALVDAIADKITDKFRKLLQERSLKEVPLSADDLVSFAFRALEVLQSSIRQEIARLVEAGEIPESVAARVTVEDADLFQKLLVAIETKLRR
jgi:hypothetical protein